MYETCEDFVKKETNDMEKEFIVPPSDVGATSMVPLKTESIFDDVSVITVKNEPITDDTLFSTTTPTVAISPECPLTNIENPVANGFIIYELDPQCYENNTVVDIQPKIQTSTIAATPSMPPKLACVPTQRLVSSNMKPSLPTPALLNRPTITKSSSPPVLLNGRLRKRPKPEDETSNQNSNTPKKKPIKQPMKPSQHSGLVKAPSSTSDAAVNTNTGTKKIINYLMHKKWSYIPGVKGLNIKPKSPSINRLEDRVEEVESSTSVIHDTDSNCPNAQQSNLPTEWETEKSADIVIKMEVLDDVIGSQTHIANEQNTTTPPEPHIKEIEIQSSTNTAPSSSSSSPAVYCNESVQTKTATSEIKVKCLCRLGDINMDQQESSSSDELKAFFRNMFQKTRRLTKQQQRAVKMSLLQAINESEEMVEKGKCCSF